MLNEFLLDGLSNGTDDCAAATVLLTHEPSPACGVSYVNEFVLVKLTQLHTNRQFGR